MNVLPITRSFVKNMPNQKEIPLIDSRDIKAILYLGIRGKISLPEEKHKVDVSA